MLVLADLVEYLDQLVTRAGPLSAAVVGGACALLGFLIIVFPVLLAWIVGLSLILAGLAVFGSIALRVKWEDSPPEHRAPAEQRGEQT
jgi:hypothetical protein